MPEMQTIKINRFQNVRVEANIFLNKSILKD